MAKKEQHTETMRPPIIAVLGHVDHGKTTLLDYIRKSSVASREHGGITQHIGAYQITWIEPKSKTKYPITFIDTPGHEAFAKMRSRGASAADIAILVVAADDGVMPQTKESIRMIAEAGVPMIVAINKTDLPTANMDKVRQDLARNGVQLEGFGGQVPNVPVSAKTGKGVNDLLEMILLVAQMKNVISKPEAPVEASVIETRVDKGKGMVATVIVKQGTLRRQTVLFDGAVEVAKIRAMFDENGTAVSDAYPGRPVEVMGFSKLPTVGAVLTATSVVPTTAVSAPVVKALDALPDFLKPIENERHLSIVLKADTAGSLEAIRESLSDKIDIVTESIGDISDADVLLAKSVGAFIVGFNVRWMAGVEKLAQTEGVVGRTYNIIYNLLDELSDVVSGMQEVLTKERQLGAGRILAEFPFDGQKVAGTKVASGRLARGDQVRIMRGQEEIGRGKIKSIRHGKSEVTKVESGAECGVLFDRQVDFQLDDDIIAFTNS